MRSKTNSKDRDLYDEYRKEWESYLDQASIDYLTNPSIKEELRRIKEIVQFSSFFRSNDSLVTLKKLRESANNEQTLLILKGIK